MSQKDKLMGTLHPGVQAGEQPFGLKANSRHLFSSRSIPLGVVSQGPSVFRGTA